ncbi:AraC family ligand binding domain-containing protein [Fusibacter paucivorans]|uniref:AraC family ligand binding domain-containing protein n=1 Tax=Fusibacter paucivorans TaxID=76009 RepID=A0ABS5PJG4_9FIRM|nr:AraC family ligand binding domain-containing protein [Fusibacter paucivorans]MBS7525248.1 AraC family ligand binding domain-containing protein [Fusibacter paucivorans]
MNQFVYKQASGITALSASFHEFSYKKHAHDEYALGVTLDGIQKFSSRGSIHASCPHGVMLFHPGFVHDGWAHEHQRLDYVMIYVDESKMKAILDTNEPHYFKDSVVYDKTLERLVYNTAFTILNDCDPAFCDDAFTLLGAHLGGLMTDAKINREHQRIQKIKWILRNTEGEPLRLDDVATAVGMSKYQMIRIFKAAVGLSPYQYYLSCKLSRAKKLIEETKEVYTAVTAEHFVDLSHLNKHFKNTYGVTANTYAKSLI